MRSELPPRGRAFRRNWVFTKICLETGANRAVSGGKSKPHARFHPRPLHILESLVINHSDPEPEARGGGGHILSGGETKLL